MIIRSKAPLRLGLAGGGTDVSPYSDLYGGAILNATLNLYAYTSIKPLHNGKIELVNESYNQQVVADSKEELALTENFELFIGVYNRVVREFKTGPLSFSLSSSIEAPQGSGLGTSSTLVVSVLGAFAEWLKLPLGSYDIAHLAYEIERNDLGMKGGKQDQYAATFGGFNYMEFFANDKVIVNPLHLKPEILNELEMNLLLYFTDTQRLSAGIISEQVKNVNDGNKKSIEAMHNLKEQAHQMKDALLKGELHKLGEILHFGWHNKKLMAGSISNDLIDRVYETALRHGATGGKISGAGGGGFMYFYCPGLSKQKVARAIEALGGKGKAFQFTQQGLTTWTVN